MQLNILSVIAVSHNSEMSQQNSEALKVTDFNLYKTLYITFDIVPYFVALWSAKGGWKGEVLRNRWQTSEKNSKIHCQKKENLEDRVKKS
jgi:hypothetical protein